MTKTKAIAAATVAIAAASMATAQETQTMYLHDFGTDKGRAVLHHELERGEWDISDPFALPADSINLFAATGLFVGGRDLDYSGVSLAVGVDFGRIDLRFGANLNLAGDNGINGLNWFFGLTYTVWQQ